MYSVHLWYSLPFQPRCSKYFMERWQVASHTSAHYNEYATTDVSLLLLCEQSGQSRQYRRFLQPLKHIYFESCFNITIDVYFFESREKLPFKAPANVARIQFIKAYINFSIETTSSLCWADCVNEFLSQRMQKHTPVLLKIH